MQLDDVLAAYAAGLAAEIELLRKVDTLAREQRDAWANNQLAGLGTLDGRLAKVVELRFFAGLSVEEVAAVLGITTRSVVRDWNKARLFLHHALETPA